MSRNWKIKREVNRLKMQVMQLPWIAASSFIRYRFDKSATEVVKYTEGSCHLHENVAVLLLYQPRGLCESTFCTINHLAKNGFSTVVVSNCPLLEKDMIRLKGTSFAILERPNYGYDFGGYRQGVLFLMEQGIVPENLLIINDSIWFPLRENCDFLTEVVSQDFGLYGLTINNSSKNINKHHIQSYLFNFKKPVLTSQYFVKYWRNLFLSNNKHSVVRQCEMKMTHYFSSRGCTVGYKYSMKNIYDSLYSLSDEDLDIIIDYQRVIDPKRTAIFQRLQDISKQNGDVDRPSRQWLGKYFLISHPLILLKVLSCPVLKRDQQFIYQAQRKAIFDSGLDEGLLGVVRDDMLRLDSDLPL